MHAALREQSATAHMKMDPEFLPNAENHEKYMKDFMPGKLEPWKCRAGQNSLIIRVDGSLLAFLCTRPPTTGALSPTTGSRWTNLIR